MIDFIIIIFILYVIPAIITYLGIRHQYMTEWTNIKPNALDFIMVITPMVNIGVALISIADLLFYVIERAGGKLTKGKFIDKFFRIKR